MLKSAAYRVYESVLSLLAPRFCLTCGENTEKTIEKNAQRFSTDKEGKNVLQSNEIELRHYICSRCFDRLPTAPEPDEILSGMRHYFPHEELALNGVIARFQRMETLDDDVKYNSASASELLHALKYHKMKRLGRVLGRELGYVLQLLGFTGYLAIVPVPIHHARQRERGYNQSDEIALGVADVLNIPVVTTLLRRKTYTLSQTYFSAVERKMNVQNVFELVGKNNNSWFGTNVLKKEKLLLPHLKGASILLVDDILTTGSTLNACATVLLEAGARKVDAATLVKA